jgi:hypothetical protein
VTELSTDGTVNFISALGEFTPEERAKLVALGDAADRHRASQEGRCDYPRPVVSPAGANVGRDGPHLVRSMYDMPVLGGRTAKDIPCPHPHCHARVNDPCMDAEGEYMTYFHRIRKLAFYNRYGVEQRGDGKWYRKNS